MDKHPLVAPMQCLKARVRVRAVVFSSADSAGLISVLDRDQCMMRGCAGYR